MVELEQPLELEFIKASSGFGSKFYLSMPFTCWTVPNCTIMLPQMVCSFIPQFSFWDISTIFHPCTPHFNFALPASLFPFFHDSFVKIGTSLSLF